MLTKSSSFSTFKAREDESSDEIRQGLRDLLQHETETDEDDTVTEPQSGHTKYEKVFISFKSTESIESCQRLLPAISQWYTVFLWERES